MGKLTSYYITFNENKDVYFCGELIYGSVVITLKEEMKFRCVKLKIVGEANVHWTERRSSGSGKNRRTHTVHYRSHESYFNHHIVVVGEDQKKLPAGQHVYPFSFQLPPNLPSSFEGAHGNVRYSMKSTIDKPWKFDHNTKRAFTVLSMLDLNHDPAAVHPCGGNDSKTVCCLCCASGPIEGDFSTDKSGYVSGEFITINANVQNHSNRELPGTKCAIIQEVIFKATTKSRTLSNTVAEIKGPGCGEHKSITWNNERLQVPAVPPSYLQFCNIIDIRYHLQFTVEIPGPSFNLRFGGPIIVGSVPLLQYRTTALAAPLGFQPSAPPPPVVPSAPPGAAVLPPPLPDYSTNPQAPPPSYATCVTGPVNIKDDDDNEYTMGETQYAPKYQYYDWNQSAFSYNQ